MGVLKSTQQAWGVFFKNFQSGHRSLKSSHGAISSTQKLGWDLALW
jgi:hypothetical protein